MNITGSILNSYMVCPRQAWMGAHGISGDKDNDLLREGLYIHEQAYQRNHDKEKVFGNNVIDTIQNKEGKLIIGEVKKSSKCIESARMQLLYYLYDLKQQGIEAEGKLQFPEEKRIESVILDEEGVRKVEQTLLECEAIISQEKPPKPRWIGCCMKCSYCECCYA